MNWKYVNDPKGFEYFSPASETIKLKLSGDCDDFAIVMAATLQAIGANTRVVMAYGEKSGHAYAEVNMGEGFNEDFDEAVIFDDVQIQVSIIIDL